MPAAIFVLLYAWFFVRGMQYGGGEPSGKIEVLLKTLGFVLLGGSAKPLLFGGVAIFVLITLRAAIAWVRAKSLDWILYAVAMVLAPLALLLSSREDFFTPRYFSVPAVFALLLLAEAFAALLAAPGISRGLGVFACLGFIAANALPLRTLWADGRGSYLEALNGICAADASPQIIVGSDHDFRYPILLSFYAPYETGCDQRLVYRQHGGTAPLPRWILRSAFRPDFRPAPEGKMPYGEQLPAGEKLVLRAFYPSSELSGWGVIVYERVP